MIRGGDVQCTRSDAYRRRFRNVLFVTVITPLNNLIDRLNILKKDTNIPLLLVYHPSDFFSTF